MVKTQCDVSTTSPSKQQQQRQEEEEQQQKQALVGIRFSYIWKEFIPQNGGIEAFQGLTTQQVIEQFIQPPTRERLESYWDYLKRQRRQTQQNQQEEEDDNDDDPCGMTASAFISHAHQYLFLETISALQHHFQDNKKGFDSSSHNNDTNNAAQDSYIFLDVFCINQHRTHWSYDFLSDTFMSSIKHFGKTIVVMSPWDDPIPFTRAWCIYEAYCTSVTGSQYEIALSETERTKFLETLKRSKPKRVIDNLLGTIQAERSEASNPTDCNQIHGIIRQSIGFAKLDALIFEQYRGWVLNTSLAALKQCDQDNYKERADLLHIVGSMYWRQGSYSNAQHYMESAVNLSKLAYGEFSERHLRCMNHLACLYIHQGEHKKAEPLCLQCMEQRSQVLGEGHPDTLASIKNLGGLLCRLGYYEKAEQILVKGLEKMKLFVGTDRPPTLAAMNNLADVYHRQGKHAESEAIYLECLEKRKCLWGDNHPKTTRSKKKLGQLYCDIGEYDKAEPLYVDCLEKMRIRLGNDNPETLQSIHSLASMYFHQGNYEKAEELFMEYMKTTKMTLGEDHSQTVTGMINLAILYHEQKKIDRAQSIMGACLERQRSILGDEHPDTARSMELLENMNQTTQEEEKRVNLKGSLLDVGNASWRVNDS